MARVTYVQKSEVGPEALPVYEELEKRIGKVLKPHMALAQALSNLAAVHGRQDRHAEAQPPQRQSLDMFEQLAGAAGAGRSGGTL